MAVEQMAPRRAAIDDRRAARPEIDPVDDIGTDPAPGASPTGVGRPSTPPAAPVSRSGLEPGVELAAGLGDGAHLLSSRRAPNVRGVIDHVVVAPTGVWVIDTKHYMGLVEQRDLGNWRTVDHRLFVNGRDQTHLVEDVTWQAAAVRAALEPIGCADVPVHPVLLFIGSGGRWFLQPIEVRDVRAMWTRKLLDLVDAPGPLDPATCQAIVARLDAEFPPAT